MTRDRKLQELASRLVEHEVLCCVSSLVNTLSNLMQDIDYKIQRDVGISWENDILPLFEAYDWEGAADDAIDNADLEQLEAMADNVGYWSDVLEDSQVPSVIECDDDHEHWWYFKGSDENFDDESAAEQAAIESVIDTIRSKIKALVTDHKDFCHEFDVDMYDWRYDVYEHWVVTRWLARKLSDMGYVTGKLCGLTIYGRACTGQSLILDRNMQQIAAELWPEELEGLE